MYGLMRDVVVVEKKTRTPDGMGGFISVWGPYKTINAIVDEVIPSGKSGSIGEIMNVIQEQYVQIKRVIVLAEEFDVDNYRFKINNKIFDIKFVNPLSALFKEYICVSV